MLRIPLLFAILLLLLGLSSCNNEEIGNYRDVKPDAVFFDYQISADDASEDVHVLLRYRFAGPVGTTLVLEAPAGVTFDGEPVPVDSSGFNGAYYEVIRPKADFAGKHVIEFTDSEGKKYTETIDFLSFGLENDFAGVIYRDSLALEFSGLPDNTKLHLLLTDTVRYSSGLEIIDTALDGRLLIDSAQLSQLKPGPVTLEIFAEAARRPKAATKEGGRILSVYNLQRNFTLK